MARRGRPPGSKTRKPEDDPDPSSRANKLSDAQRRVVIEYVIAGRSNKEIVQKLNDDGDKTWPVGFVLTLSRQALSYYRALPEVRDAIGQQELESLQSGLTMRARRLTLFSAALDECRKRMGIALDPAEKASLQAPDMKTFVDGAHVLVKLGKVMAEMIDPPIRQEEAPSATENEPTVQHSLISIKAEWNDMLEKFLVDREAAIAMSARAADEAVPDEKDLNGAEVAE